MCDLDQRSRPKALGREAGVSHRLRLVLPGPSMPPLLSSIAGIQRVSRVFAELILPAQGREPPFQWPSLTSTPKQALTGREAAVWKGKPCPNSGKGPDSGEPHPSAEMSLTSCWSPVVA